MTITHRDADSPYKLRMPSADNPKKAITTARKYIAYEQNRPAEQQTPYTPRMAALLVEIDNCEAKIADAKTRRAVAAEAVNRFDDRAKTLISYMMKIIDATYPDTPAKATEWGLTVKQSTKNIMTPTNRDDRMAVMKAYIAKENSRPETERFTSPNLAEVVEVWQGLVDNIKARDEGQNDWEAAIAACKRQAELLAKDAQSAAVHLLALEYNHVLSPALQNWGYDVVRKRTESTGTNGDSAPTSEEPAANDSQSGNGLTEAVLDSSNDNPLL